MQHAVVKLTDYAKSEGIKITYKSKRSIFRTRAEQEAIYRTARSGYAAKPGSSRHETGEAVDITIQVQTPAIKMIHNTKISCVLAKYGLYLGW